MATDTAASSALLEMRGIHVSFGGVTALVDETFTVGPGEIVGLLGHNGAGKSTLVNVATGALRPQRGQLWVDDKMVPLRGNPREMERAGIKVIHQEPALAANLSIADNITLGRPEERQSAAARRRKARDALDMLGSDLNVDRPVSSLEFGQRQIVDLARALSTNVHVLFLDEPTGALGQSETDRLHALLRQLAASGRGIVYVSHRLKDIIAICTRLVVLRGGRVLFDRPTAGFSLTQLSEALAPGIEAIGGTSFPAGDDQVRLRARYHGQDIHCSKGEIVGLFGMASGPQFKLLDGLYGLSEGAEATIDEVAFAPRSPREAIARGVFYVSANREQDGLLSSMSALDNLVLPWLNMHTRHGLFSHSAAAASYEKARAALNIRGGHMDAPVAALSGGNRQKIVLGRWLFGLKPNLLMLAQPTQGVDIGARLDIVRTLRSLADQGVSILVASAEADEIALVSDRAYVCEGTEWIGSARGGDWEERLLQGLIARSER